MLIHGERHYCCSHCSYKTYRKDMLNDHMVKHSRNGKNSVAQHMIIQYERSEKGNRLYKCAGCSYKTDKKYRLTLHIKSHVNKDGIHEVCTVPSCKTCERHTCSICQKQCVSTYTLATHMALHHGIHNYMYKEKTKRHQCSDCPYKTHMRSELNNHRKIHYKEGIHVTCPVGNCESCKLRNNKILSQEKNVSHDILTKQIRGFMGCTDFKDASPTNDKSTKQLEDEHSWSVTQKQNNPAIHKENVPNDDNNNMNKSAEFMEWKQILENIDADLSILCNFMGNDIKTVTKI